MWLPKLRHRVWLIAALVIAAGLSLWSNVRRTASPERPGRPVSLGLDLQGGIHLGLELDQSVRVSADPDADLDAALLVLRKRVDEFGVAERVVQRVGDRIVVELPGFTDPARAREIVERSAFLELRLTDGRADLIRALPAMDRALAAAGIRPEADESVARPVDRLLGADSTRAGAGTLSVLITPGALPGEYRVPAARMARVDSLLRLPEARRLWPRGIDLRWSTAADGGSALLYAVAERPIITGTSLESARAQLNPLTGSAEVAFELDRTGGRRFGDVTGRHVGDYLAILLDGKVQGRPPVIESRIDRHGRIQLGGRTLAEASDLALVLRAGALPTPLSVVEQYEIGPSLGEDSIRGGIEAGIAGSAAVVAMVVGYYGWSGALAVAALAIYALLCLGAIALFGGALTLPGLAGFVLSVGMAVDANVLIFERIREERERGAALRAAIGDGFRHALPAIVDSNLTTLLTALFLFRFGTGPVQGFAVTLSVGIVASMFTAVFVTRTFYLLWLRKAGDDARLSIGRWRLFGGSRFRFFAWRRWAYAVTALLFVAGLAFGIGRGVRYGVDFTGGTASKVETAAPVDLGRVRTALAAHGIEGAEVQRFGGDRGVVVRAGPTTDLDARRAAVAAALDETAGPGGYTVRSTEGTSPKVGEELQTKALTAIGLSFAAVLAYLAIRFEWRFGLAAVIATAHDILATLAFIAILDLEVSLVVVAALLTVVGYSLNDTIVIFDRVREVLRGRRPEPSEALLDRSVNETLPRTVMTGGTALACLIALAVFGGEVIRPFALVMFFGIFVGTFSSVFVASPVLAWIHARWPAAAPAGSAARAADGSLMARHP